MRTANAVLRLRKMKGNAVGNLGSRMIHAVPRLRMANAGPRLRKRIFNAVTMFWVGIDYRRTEIGNGNGQHGAETKKREWTMRMANAVPRLRVTTRSW